MTKPLREAIEEILLLHKADLTVGREWPKSVDKATSQILELFKGIVPPELPMSTGSDDVSIRLHHYEVGYNQCRADILNKIKEEK